MPDLFNTPESPSPPKKKYYKGKKGKFTDKESARMYEIEKERDVYKNNYEFYKQQAQRLSNEVKQEKKRADALQLQLNAMSKTNN